MEKKKHSCKYCHKNFLSGKMLGGHMRAHLADDRHEEEDPQQECTTSYVLRQNPKKSQRVSTMDEDNKENVVPCKICAKQFPSQKSLFGHMRLHSIKKELFVCKDCGKEYLSAKSLYNHERAYCKSKQNNSTLVVPGRLSDENVMNLVRRKRSCRQILRYNNNTPTCSSNSSALNNVICSVAEFDCEMEEAAIALIMLSRGEGSWGRFKNSYTQTEDDGNCVCRKKLDSCNLGIKIFLSEKKIVRCSEFESGVLSGERVNDELQPVDSTIHELGYESGDVLCIAEKDDHGVYENQQPNEKISCDDFFSDSLDCRPIKRAKIGVCEADLADSFKCKTCNRTFHSYQALGGHQTSHRTKSKTPAVDDKADFATEIEEADCEYDDQKLEDDEISADQEETAGGESKESSVEHKCLICFKVFVSGQALGGHKKAHANKIHDTNLNSADMLNVHVHSNDESKEC